MTSTSTVLDFVPKHKLAFGLAAGVGVFGAWYIYGQHFLKIPYRYSHKFYKDVYNSNTLLSEYITPEILLNFKNVKTSKGYSLADLLRNGFSHIKNSGKKEPGIIVGDEECYEVFRELIEPLLTRFYKIDDLRSLVTPIFEKGDWRKVNGGRLVDKRILSCVMSTSRNVKGCPFVSTMTNNDREDIAAIFIRVLTRLSVPYRGDYARLCNLAKWQQERLHLFEHYNIPSTADDLPPILSHSWPDGRLLWWTEDRRCKAFINFADHIKFVVSRAGGDLQQALKDYMELVAYFELYLKEYEERYFAWNPKYGYLTSNLTDLGTGLHVEVMLKFYVLHKSEFFERLKIMMPVVCQSSDQEGRTDIFTISNKNAIGITEVQVIQQMADAITLLLEIDKRLAKGESAKDIMP